MQKALSGDRAFCFGAMGTCLGNENARASGHLYSGGERVRRMHNHPCLYLSLMRFQVAEFQRNLRARCVATPLSGLHDLY